MIKKIVFCSFLIFYSYLPSFSQVLYQALLLNDKDTLTMWQTFVTPPYSKLQITSNDSEMSLSTCFSSGFFSVWKIKNDSIFLIELADESDHVHSNNIDLKKAFQDRLIRDGVFANEITYQIEAQFLNINDENMNKVFCITIEKGLVKDKSLFENKTEYFNVYQYLSPEAIQKNTNWEQLPPITVDRLVTVKVTTDDAGKIIKAVVIKNNENTLGDVIKMQGEEVWQNEALRQVKLIPRWNVIYKCGQVVDKEDTLEFLFSKRQ